MNQALILLGHGSTKNSHSNAAVLSHVVRAKTMQARFGQFTQILPAFWKQAPYLLELLDLLPPGLGVVIVPMFASEGYFVKVAIPKALGLDQENPFKTTRHGPRQITYTRPVGTSPLLLEGVKNEVERVLAGMTPQEGVTILVVGHGTTRHSGSSQITRGLSALLAGPRRRCLTAYLDEDPRVDRVLTDQVNTRRVIVVPYFMASGLHVLEDLPRMLGVPEGMVQGEWCSVGGRELMLLPPAGQMDHLLEVVEARVVEALMRSEAQ